MRAICNSSSHAIGKGYNSSSQTIEKLSLRKRPCYWEKHPVSAFQRGQFRGLHKKTDEKGSQHGCHSRWCGIAPEIKGPQMTRVTCVPLKQENHGKALAVKRWCSFRLMLVDVSPGFDLQPDVHCQPLNAPKNNPKETNMLLRCPVAMGKKGHPFIVG